MYIRIYLFLVIKILNTRYGLYGRLLYFSTDFLCYALILIGGFDVNILDIVYRYNIVKLQQKIDGERPGAF